MKKVFLQSSLALLLLGVGMESCKSKTKDTTTTATPVTIDTPATAAPVVVNNDATIRSSVDAVIKSYPNVTADVQNGKVTLRGTVNNRDEMQKIVMGVNEAQIRNFDNQITVKK